MDFHLELTEGPATAAGQARTFAAMKEVTAIVAAGGDGTANEVLNGLMQAKEQNGRIPDFGVLPVGRGNDLGYGMRIPHDLSEAVRVLAQNRTRPVDLGFVTGGDFPEGRYFGNGIGIGFDTIVGFEAAKLKRIKGFGAYLVGALKTMLFYYNTPLLNLEHDGGSEQRNALQVSVMNGRRMGGAFYMAPDADPADGLLDICIAGTPKRLAMLGVIVQYLKGTQAGNPHITMFQTTSLRVSPVDATIAVHADGETICTDGSTLEIRIVPHALQVISGHTPD